MLELREEQYRLVGAAQRGALAQAQAVIDSQRSELEQARVISEECREQLREAQKALEDLTEPVDITRLVDLLAQWSVK